jgi:hypothetical protein
VFLPCPAPNTMLPRRAREAQRGQSPRR